MDTRSILKARHPLFFSAGAMAFFRSRLESVKMAGDRIYFVTSEQYVPVDHSYSEPRLYTLRVSTLPVGPGRPEVDTVGEFQQYATLDEAKVAMKLAAFGAV